MHLSNALIKYVDIYEEMDTFLKILLENFILSIM